MICKFCSSLGYVGCLDGLKDRGVGVGVEGRRGGRGGRRIE